MLIFYTINTHVAYLVLCEVGVSEPVVILPKCEKWSKRQRQLHHDISQLSTRDFTAVVINNSHWIGLSLLVIDPQLPGDDVARNTHDPTLEQEGQRNHQAGHVCCQGPHKKRW